MPANKPSNQKQSCKFTIKDTAAAQKILQFRPPLPQKSLNPPKTGYLSINNCNFGRQFSNQKKIIRQAKFSGAKLQLPAQQHKVYYMLAVKFRGVFREHGIWTVWWTESDEASPDHGVPVPRTHFCFSMLPTTMQTYDACLTTASLAARTKQTAAAVVILVVVVVIVVVAVFVLVSIRGPALIAIIVVINSSFSRSSSSCCCCFCFAATSLLRDFTV